MEVAIYLVCNNEYDEEYKRIRRDNRADISSSYDDVNVIRGKGVKAIKRPDRNILHRNVRQREGRR